VKRTVWTEDGVELIEAEPDALRPGWARLRVAACGICGSDLHVWHMPASERGPCTPGHEICGTVEQGPAGLADALYAVEPYKSCGKCDACKRGEGPLCARMGLFGFQYHGGFAEYVDVPVERLHPVRGIDRSPLVALAEPTAVAVRGCNIGRFARGEQILVVGAGTIGLLSGLVARERGARVSITARYPHQANAAKALGLEPVGERELEEFTADAKPFCVIETVGGSGAALRQAIAATASGGRVVLLGISAEVTLNLMEVVGREVDLLGSLMYGDPEGRSEFAEGVRILEEHAAELEPLLTHEFPLVQVEDGFLAALDKNSGALKVSITA